MTCKRKYSEYTNRLLQAYTEVIVRTKPEKSAFEGFVNSKYLLTVVIYMSDDNDSLKQDIKILMDLSDLP